MIDAVFSSAALADDIAKYRAELERSPDDPRAHNNLGVVYARQGDPSEAIAHFDNALRLDPDHLHAYMNRGSGLVALGRHDEAVEAFARVLAATPDNYRAHAQRGFACAHVGRHDEALEHFSATLELDRHGGDAGSQSPTFLYTTQAKLQHDAEQFRHLAEQGERSKFFGGLGEHYDELREGIDWPQDQSELVAMPAQLPDEIATTYNRPLHVGACPALADGAVSSTLDAAHATSQFLAADSGVAYVDDLLTPAALDGLNRFFRESTIWFDFAHMPGHVAAYLETGLASPLLLQIAAEARVAFPEILGPHPLKQVWAFKNVSRGQRIGLHVDDAAVSLNLWLTADEACDAAESGGLTVYRQRLDAARELRSYEADRDDLHRALAEDGATPVSIAYRQNRAVLFDSTLYHESTGTNFAPGFDNHRVNVTLLYGERART